MALADNTRAKCLRERPSTPPTLRLALGRKAVTPFHTRSDSKTRHNLWQRSDHLTIPRHTDSKRGNRGTTSYKGGLRHEP